MAKTTQRTFRIENALYERMREASRKWAERLNLSDYGALAAWVVAVLREAVKKELDGE